MSKRIILVLICALFFHTSCCLAKDAGFTKEDRERLIRLEATLKVFMQQVDKRFEQVDRRISELRVDMNKRFEQVDKRFEQVDKRFEQQMTFMWILAGIFTALVAAIIGLVIWDRRTALRHAVRESEARLDERYGLTLIRKVVEVLKERAKSDKELATILRTFGLL